MKWTVGESRTIYDCPWFRLDLSDVTLPDGRRIEHHVIRVPAPSVGVVATDEDGRVLLLYRHRFITDRWGWELPGGAVEPGEDPAEAALRELEEETGLRGAGARLMTRFATSNGLIDQEFLLYQVSDPSPGRPIVSVEESDEIRWVGVDEQRELLAAGQIHDGPTLVALLLHQHR